MSILRCLGAVVLMFSALAAIAQQNSAVPYSELRWRCIGPFRAGRTVAIGGIPDQPNVFFMAPNNGGVWKTDDFGRTWAPIFDGQPTGSVGALALAPSDPNIIYVGSGEGLRRPDLSTGGRTGPISACAMASRLDRFSSIPVTQTACTWRSSDILTVLMRNAVFFAQPMAGKRFRKFFTRTKTQAQSTWPSIPRIPERFTLTCGLRAVHRGVLEIPTTRQEAGFTNRSMGAITGRQSGPSRPAPPWRAT